MEPLSLLCLHQYTGMLFIAYGPQTYIVYIMALVNLRCLQYGPIQPFLQPDKHKPDTT